MISGLKENDESDNGEESPTLTCPNNSSSEDDAVGELRRKKNRMPKGEDFRPEIDMANPGFKIGLKFVTAELFRKAVRIYSINYGRELIFIDNDQQVHQDYGYRPSRATVYRTRAMAVDIVEGSYSKQYEVL
ncbi:unnamed protein product [Prunus armeniaca]